VHHPEIFGSLFLFLSGVKQDVETGEIFVAGNDSSGLLLQQEVEFPDGLKEIVLKTALFLTETYVRYRRRIFSARFLQTAKHSQSAPGNPQRRVIAMVI
jgi:hypothetical protein